MSPRCVRILGIVSLLFVANAASRGAPATKFAGPATRPTNSPTLADLAATQPSNRPPLQPIAPPADALTDEKITLAIRRAAHFLLAQFSSETYHLAELPSPGGGLGSGPLDDGYPCGENALAVYALMQAGLTLDDPRLKPNSPLMNGLVEGMKRLPATTGKVTYARGIRAAALALYNRPQDRKALTDDVEYLIHGHSHGAYTYSHLRQIGHPWDNSNSQYGLLGVWSGAEVGIEVPSIYWEDVQGHWNGTQFPDGRWAYFDGEMPTQTMTAAGITSLFIAHDYLDLPTYRHGGSATYVGAGRYAGDVGRDPFTPQLRKALDWWEVSDNYIAKTTHPNASYGYAVYGVERVGLASGFKYFGTHDWFREMAGVLVAKQFKNGSWGGVIDTSYCLIFLARGRHPVMFNKLRFDRVESVNNRYWANRPRDAANLARWAGRELERPLNWQVVNLERDWWDWMDSPVLYFASHRPLRFSPDDYAKFRGFVQAGGMIFTQADGDSSAFNEFIREFAKKLFPQYEFQDLPATHPLYSVDYPLKNGKPPLKAITNGSRILLLHSPREIAWYWQQRDDKIHKDLFRFGANVFLYAAGKRDLRNKLDSPYVPEPAALPVTTVDVVRLQYNGNLDPEPYAWEHFRRVFQFATGYGLNVQGLRVADLRPGQAPIAHLTGTAGYEFSATEIAALKAFVEAGGVVLIDGCGGSATFADSARAAVSRAFPERKFVPINPGHKLLAASAAGMNDLSKPKLRQYVIEKIGPKLSGMEILTAGKGHVILSPLDLTTGLLGANTWGIWGYEPAYAQGVVGNLVFWTLDGQHD